MCTQLLQVLTHTLTEKRLAVQEWTRRKEIHTSGHLDIWTSVDIWTFGLSPEPYPVITAKRSTVIPSAVTSMLFDISSLRGTEPASPGIRTVFFNQGRRHTKPKAKERATARRPHIPHVVVPLTKLRHSQGNLQASRGITYSRQCIITTLYFESLGLEHSGISGWRASQRRLGS